MNRTTNVLVSVFLVWILIKYDKKVGYLHDPPTTSNVSYISKAKCDDRKKDYRKATKLDDTVGLKCIGVPFADRQRWKRE